MSQSERNPQRGSALVLAIFVLALLTAMGAALLFLSQNEIKMAGASVQPKKAFYMAEAGLEHARQALWLKNGADDFRDDLQEATGNTSALPDPLDLIGFDPQTIAPVYDASGDVIGFSGYDNDKPLVPLQRLDDGWYAAFMSNDYGETRTNSVDTDNRVILTGVGVGPDQSFEVVEAVINVQTWLPEFPPSAIFLLGPTPTFSSADSGAKAYTGNDCGVSGGDYFPIVGTIGHAAEQSAEAGADSGPSYEAGPYNTAEDTIVDMTASPVTGMSDSTYSMKPEWDDCQAMKDLVEGLRTVADVTCADSTSLAKSSCPADVSNPQNIYFGDGDLDVSDNAHHYGMLVVTGELALSGSLDFDGIILVVGEGVMRYNGTGGGRINGSIIVANIAGPDGDYGTADDCTGGTNGFGSAIYDERGGGNSGINYCSASIQASNPAKPYEILEFRQH